MVGSSAAWVAPPSMKYGGSLLQAGQATTDATALNSVAPTPVHALGGVLSPGSPMFAFAVIAAIGVGLMAYSTVEVHGGGNVGKKIHADANLKL